MEPKETNMIECLNEYGIDIQKVDKISEKELLENGYKKVDDDSLDNIGALLQYIPGLAVDAFERVDAINKSKKLLDGAYKVSIKDGMHLAKSKATKGAYRATLLSNSTNQVAGQAELFKIENAFKLAQAPKYALCIFDAVSAVVGQYYMAEINHRLIALEKKTDKILGYLENTVRGELWADDKILNEIMRNADQIENNDLLRTAYLQQVLEIKKDSLAKMTLFDLEIAASRKGVNTASKEEELYNYIGMVEEYYPKYICTLNLFAKCLFCEIALARITDPVLLGSMKDELLHYVEKYNISIAKDREDLTKLIGNANAYNLKKLPKLGYRRYGFGNVSRVGTLLSLYEAAATVENAVADYKDVKKNNLIGKLNEDMDDFGDTAAYIEQANRIDEYKTILSNPIEILMVGDNAYIKNAKA